MVDLVGFAGRKGTGKGAAASVLIRYKQFREINFADSLKETVVRLFGVSTLELTDRELKERPLDRWPYKSPRTLLQEVGDTMRNVDPEVWIREWSRRVSFAREYGRSVVCSDIRYPNEASIIRQFGGVVVKVVDPRKQNLDGHRSETLSDSIDYDYLLVNQHPNVEEFKEYVRGCLTDWRIL